MAKLRIYQFGGVKQKVSPFLHEDGDLLVCENLDNYPSGAKTKRSGYEKFLGTLPGTVSSMFVYPYPTNTNVLYYAYAGSVLHYSEQGTGAWMVAGSGTFSGQRPLGYGAMGTVLMVGDGSVTRHSTNGTSFTDTTLAPAGDKFAEFRQRMFIAYGTVLYASELGSPTGWSISSTNPSYSEPIEGYGVINSLFSANDELVVTKDSGAIVHFDGYRKYVSPSNDAPGHYTSVANLDGVRFYTNPEGVWGFNTKPQKVSEPVQPMFYNNSGSAPSESYLRSSSKAVAFKDNYYTYIGTTTSDIYPQTVANCIMKYDLSRNEWSWYKIPLRTYSMFYDYTQDGYGWMFGNINQAYRFSPTATSDDGQAISATMIGFLHFREPDRDKRINRLTASASPGCGATFQIAMSDTLTLDNLMWIDIGDLYSGTRKFIPDLELRGKFMFYKLHESSTDKPFTFYGFTVDFDYVGE